MLFCAPFSMRLLKRLIAVTLYTAVGVASSFVFLFVGTPYPPEWCVAVSDDRCVGVLFFLPRTWQQVAGVVVVAWCLYSAWGYRLEEEAERRTNAQNAVDLERIRERLRTEYPDKVDSEDT